MAAFLVVTFMALATIGALVVASTVPAPRQVHTPGAIAIDAREFIERRPLFDSSLPAPTMSLDDLRCAEWQASNAKPCPDPATLAGRMWSDAIPSSKTLYIAVHDHCLTYGSLNDVLNVEYVVPKRTLIVHCYSVEPWLSGPNGGNTRQQDSIVLIAASTRGVNSGSIAVFEDDRIEHLVGDDSTQALLGIVSIR